MASLDDLKKRIASVKSTQKITKAMKMVAAAKLRRAQESAEKGRPYSEKMNNIILNLSNGISDKENAPKLLSGTGEDKIHLCVVLTSDRGLCGGFNTNIIKKAKAYFLFKNTLVGVTWAPASQGSSLVPIFYARWAGDLLPLQITHIFVFCSSLVGVFRSGGTPKRLFVHFFRKDFETRLIKHKICKFVQERLFLQRQKVCSKDPIRYVGWGLLRDPLLLALFPQ